MRKDLLLVWVSCALLAGCQSSPPEQEIDWIELLDSPRAEAGVAQARFVPEPFTGDALEFRQTPTALELLEFYRYKNAARLAAAKGLWPQVSLPGGHSVPDPRHPIRTLLGWSYEPSYVIVGEANALILRTSKGTRVVPLDPDRPIGFPDDGSPDQRRARNSFLRSFDRDHRALDDSPDSDDPRVEP